MIECGKCKEWFHNLCLNVPESTLNQTLLYFCKDCLSRDTRKSLRIITIDYSKEHTKPLFKKYDILSIFNLYPYFCLIELYKVLKSRTPYCFFELFQYKPNQTDQKLTLKIPAHNLRCQKQNCLLKIVLLWNLLNAQYQSPIKFPTQWLDNNSTLRTLNRN